MNTCRFCLNSFQNVQLQLLSMYSTCTELILPEIDLNLTEAPQICCECLKSLQDAYKFKTRCLEVEEKLKNLKNVKVKSEVESNEDNATFYEITDNVDDNSSKSKQFDLDMESENQMENVQFIKEEVEEDSESFSETTRNYTESENENDNENEQEIEIENVTIKNEIEIAENEITPTKNTTNLKRLRKNKYYPNRYKCNECHKTFDFKSRLLYHSLSHSREDNVCGCEICGKSFYRMIKLKSHINTAHRHVKIICYQCSECGLEFNENKALVALDFLKCKNCQGKIRFKLDIGKEVPKVTKKPDESISKSIESKKFVAKVHLQSEMKKVESQKQEIKMHSSDYETCSVCGEEFKEKLELKSHLKTHE